MEGILGILLFCVNVNKKSVVCLSSLTRVPVSRKQPRLENKQDFPKKEHS